MKNVMTIIIALLFMPALLSYALPYPDSGGRRKIAPKTAKMNPLQLEDLGSFAGQNLTVFYVNARKATVGMEYASLELSRILDLAGTFPIPRSGIVDVPSTAFSYQFFHPTALKVLIHEQDTVFVKSDSPAAQNDGTHYEVAPGDTRVPEGTRKPIKDFEITIGWDYLLRDHPGIQKLNGTESVYQFSPIRTPLKFSVDQ